MANERPGLGASSFLSMGLTVAAALAVGMVLGWLVDHLAGTSPLFLLVGLAVGLVGGVAYMINKFRTVLNQRN